MNIVSRKMLIIGMFCEAACFMYVYYYGKQGLVYYWSLEQKKVLLLQEIVILEQDLERFSTELVKSRTEFGKEKIARERLFMKKDEETVYFLNHKE